MNIFIGSLPFDVDDQELRGYFEEYGEVSTAKIIYDRDTGRSRGFGFVEMPDDEAAQKAIEELDQADIEGRTIKVNKAEDRRNNSRGGGYNRGGGGGYNRGGGGGGYRDRDRGGRDRW